mmetsp:Transcript_56451/g.157141  ORF Transcript_56451/g.157141 Transcript_56451/m.157141 type:complete len:615 (-) Transcript_56451:19-1863(-)
MPPAHARPDQVVDILVVPHRNLIRPLGHQQAATFAAVRAAGGTVGRRRPAREYREVVFSTRLSRTLGGGARSRPPACSLWANLVRSRPPRLDVGDDSVQDARAHGRDLLAERLARLRQDEHVLAAAILINEPKTAGDPRDGAGKLLLARPRPAGPLRLRRVRASGRGCRRGCGPAGLRHEGGRAVQLLTEEHRAAGLLVLAALAALAALPRVFPHGLHAGALLLHLLGAGPAGLGINNHPVDNPRVQRRDDAVKPHARPGQQEHVAATGVRRDECELRVGDVGDDARVPAVGQVPGGRDPLGRGLFGHHLVVQRLDVLGPGAARLRVQDEPVLDAGPRRGDLVVPGGARSRQAEHLVPAAVLLDEPEIVGLLAFRRHCPVVHGVGIEWVWLLRGHVVSPGSSGLGVDDDVVVDPRADEREHSALARLRHHEHVVPAGVLLDEPELALVADEGAGAASGPCQTGRRPRAQNFVARRTLRRLGALRRPNVLGPRPARLLVHHDLILHLCAHWWDGVAKTGARSRDHKHLVSPLILLDEPELSLVHLLDLPSLGLMASGGNEFRLDGGEVRLAHVRDSWLFLVVIDTAHGPIRASPGTVKLGSREPIVEASPLALSH